jgi:protein-S-isoprenylcysteine O-methyltransferase Ste14
MSATLTPQTQTTQEDNDAWVRLGGWLFERRSWLPWPLLVPLLVLPPSSVGLRIVVTGVALAATGELVRLWAVRHIGVISRTRAERLGPLVASGPFRYVRNPLYLGNLALWAGLGLAAGLPRPTIAIVALLALAYHAIVRWEERLLDRRVGEPYRAYARRVPRWIPRVPAHPDDPPSAAPFSWRDTLFSERGTLIAIAAGCAWLVLRQAIR